MVHHCILACDVRNDDRVSAAVQDINGFCHLCYLLMVDVTMELDLLLDLFLWPAI